MTNPAMSMRALSWSVVLGLAMVTAWAEANADPAGPQNTAASDSPPSTSTVVSGFEKSGRQFVLSVLGVELEAGFAATIDIDGKRIVLSSEEGEPVGNPEDSKEATPYGEANVTTSSIKFPQADVTLGLKMGGITKEGIVLLQPFLKNTGSRPIKLTGLQNLAASAGRSNHDAGGETRSVDPHATGSFQGKTCRRPGYGFCR